MVSIDTQKALFTYIYNLLTEDATLKAAMGGEVRLFPTWAGIDAQFPYLVHRFDLSPLGFVPMRIATYYLDLWSDSPNVSEILTMRDQIIILLDETYPAPTEIAAGRLWIQTEGFVPEVERGIWHYATQWNLRYYRKSEMASLLAR